MRIQVAWFGMELDFYLGPTTVDDDPEPESVEDHRASFTSYPVGFAPSVTPEWEIPPSYHTFDPGDEDEDT